MNKIMKKFVGNVNGKAFDNEIDFNAAAKEAIKSNDGHLSISSYYLYDVKNPNKIEDKEDNDEQKLEKKKINLNKEDYILVDQKPDSINGYEVSSDLYEKLINADNKDEIRKTVENLLTKIEDSSKDVEKTVKNLEIELESIQDELYDKREYAKDLKWRKLYYNEIKNVLDKKVPSKNKANDRKDAKSDFNNIDFGGFDIIANDSLYSILKKLGL